MKKIFVLDQLFDGAPVRKFPRKAELFPENTTDGLYQVVSGRIRVSAIMEDGQVLTMNTVEPGEPFPLPIYFSVPVPPRVIYTAETNVSAQFRPRAEADAFLYSHPEVLYGLVKQILDVLYGRINSLLRNTAEKKVLHLLVQLSGRWSKPGDHEFEITTTQQDLADAVNLSRESVNIILNKLADSGVLKMGRNKIIMDVSKARHELEKVKPTDELCGPGAAAAEARDLDLMR